MKEVVLKYGLIGGLVLAAPMFIIIPNIDSIGFEKGETILFTTMIVSFLAIYIGIGSYRKKLGGYIGFRQALATGLMITIFMSVFYVAAFNLLSYVISPNFPDKYTNFMVSQMKLQHKSQTEIDNYLKSITAGKSQSSFITLALSFITPITYGLFFTISSSFILRKKEFTPSAN